MLIRLSRNASKSLTIFTALCLVSANANATMFGGVEFPNGISSFADAWISYDPLFGGGPAPTDSDDPSLALGAPNCCSAPYTQVPLGHGGLLEVAFVDNVLTNSGDGVLDLWIFEGGSGIEATFAAVRPADSSTLALILGFGATDPNGDSFFDIGRTNGSTSGIDIDSFFSGFGAGQLRFDAVQLIDDPNQGSSTGKWVGADIDAVGAISVPEPGTAVLLCVGLAALGALGEHFKSGHTRQTSRNRI